MSAAPPPSDPVADKVKLLVEFVNAQVRIKMKKFKEEGVVGHMPGGTTLLGAEYGSGAKDSGLITAAVYKAFCNEVAKTKPLVIGTNTYTCDVLPPEKKKTGDRIYRQFNLQFWTRLNGDKSYLLNLHFNMTRTEAEKC